MPTPGLMCDSSGLLTTTNDGDLIVGEEGDRCCCSGTASPCPCTPPYLTPLWWAACRPESPPVERLAQSFGRVLIRAQAQGNYRREAWLRGSRNDDFEHFETAQHNTFLEICVRYSPTEGPTVGVRGYTAWRHSFRLTPGQTFEREGTLTDAAALLTSSYVVETLPLELLLVPGAPNVTGRGYGFRPSYAGAYVPVACGASEWRWPDPDPTCPLGTRFLSELQDRPEGGAFRSLFDIRSGPCAGTLGTSLDYEQATYFASWTRVMDCSDPDGGGDRVPDTDSFPNPGGSDFAPLVGTRPAETRKRGGEPGGSSIRADASRPIVGARLPDGIDPATLRPFVGGCDGCGL